MIDAINEFEADQNKRLLEIISGHYTKEGDTFSFELDQLPVEVRRQLQDYVSKVILERKQEIKEVERKRKRREADQRRREKQKQMKQLEQQQQREMENQINLERVQKQSQGQEQNNFIHG